MADAKISALTELTALAGDDELVVVDKSDTTDAASGTTKRATWQTVVGGEMASWKLMMEAASMVIHDQAAATLALVAGSYALPSPLSFVTSGATSTGVLPVTRLLAAQGDIAGTTTNYRLNTQVCTNGSTPGTMTFIFGLYPVTVGGAADTLTFTLGTVVAGSTVTHTNPAINNILPVTGSVFTPAVSGTYCLGCVTNATLGNNAAVQLSAQLYRYNTL